MSEEERETKRKYGQERYKKNERKTKLFFCRI